MKVLSDRFTTPAQAMQSLRDTMRANPGAPERLYRCNLCFDSGWQEIDTEGRGTVKRCPKGCDTPRPRSAARLEQPPAHKKPGSFS